MTDHPNVPAQIRGAIGLITEEETAATLLLTSTDTLATWRSQKKGPMFVKLGKRVFYTVNNLRVWVEAKAQEQNAPAVPAEFKVGA